MAPTSQYLTFSAVLLLCLHLHTGMVCGDGSLDATLTVPASSMQTNVCSESTVPRNSWKVVHRAGPYVLDGIARVDVDEIYRQELLRAAYLHNRVTRVFADGSAGAGNTSADPLQASLQQHRVTLPARSGVFYAASFSYLVTLAIGTPGKSQTVILDTGSSVLWVQCMPCNECHRQRESMFDPRQSATYRLVRCDDPACTNMPAYQRGCDANNTCTYNLSYADGSSAGGVLAKDTLTLSKSGGDEFRQFAFGCGHQNRVHFIGAAGVLGLSRDFHSLATQTSDTYKNVFSYCLPSTHTAVGYLALGGSGAPNPSYTPMLHNEDHPSLYFLNLIGISVDNRRLAISATSAFRRFGTLIDCGTSISRIAPAAYAVLRRAFREGMRQRGRQVLSVGVHIMDTCYDIDVGRQGFFSYPRITLHFAGSTSIQLSFAQVFDRPNPINGTKYCLGFSSSLSDGISVLGNIQQRGMEVIYDIGGNRIGFYQGSRCP